MKQFKANLSSKSLKNLMSQLELHGKKLVQAQKDVLDALADYVYERIMFYVPVKTGQLMESFVEDVSNDIARVYTDLYYAKYVEFGTGIRGINSEYDSKYINAKTDYDSEYAGQVAQKFIYKAVQDLEKDYIEIATNVLRKKGLI